MQNSQRCHMLNKKIIFLTLFSLFISTAKAETAPAESKRPRYITVAKVGGAATGVTIAGYYIWQKLIKPLYESPQAQLAQLLAQAIQNPEAFQKLAEQALDMAKDDLESEKSDDEDTESEDEETESNEVVDPSTIPLPDTDDSNLFETDNTQPNTIQSPEYKQELPAPQTLPPVITAQETAQTSSTEQESPKNICIKETVLLTLKLQREELEELIKKHHPEFQIYLPDEKYLTQELKKSFIEAAPSSSKKKCKSYYARETFLLKNHKKLKNW